jgi:hypothetical protein
VGGDGYYEKVTDRWCVTAVGTGSAGVSATKSATSGRARTVTGIACSGDAAAVVTIESPSGTKLWQKRFAAAFNMSESFVPGTIQAAGNADILVKVSASSSNSEANLLGLSIDG